MKRKIKIMSFRPDERLLFEDYLNKMSSLGWQFSWCTNSLIAFTQEEISLHYYVDYSLNYASDIDSHQNDSKTTFMDELGYELLCKTDYFLIFTSQAKQVNTFYTEEESEKTVIQKRLKNYFCDLFLRMYPFLQQ